MRAHLEARAVPRKNRGGGQWWGSAFPRSARQAYPQRQVHGDCQRVLDHQQVNMLGEDELA